MWTLFETEAQGQLGNGLLKGQVLNSNGIDQQILLLKILMFIIIQKKLRFEVFIYQEINQYQNNHWY